MILLALSLAAQAAPAAIPGDIVVTGRRAEQLKRLRMTTRLDRKAGVTRCIFKRRSGDRALDAAVCDAALACVPIAKTEIEMRDCLAPTLDALVAKGAQWRAKAVGNGG